jgi:O-succinylbenzoic acid--CoA ligase
MLDEGADVGGLGTLLMGAAPISADRLSELSGLKQKVYQGFGMTETCSHMALRRLNPPGDGIYRALPGVQWRVDQEGCLCLRGAATAHRWMHTRDRVRSEGDGFQWLGRADWVINVGGMKVHPEVVEERLNLLRMQIPQLNTLLTGDFVITGRIDPYKGQVPVCVVEDPSVNPDIQSPLAGEIDPRYSLDWLKPHLKSEEIPRMLLRIPQFPRSSLGKILRQQLSVMASVF